MKKLVAIVFIFIVASATVALVGCGPRDADGQSLSGSDAADHVFALRTTMAEGRMVFVGVGGDIEGMVNPDLPVVAGNSVQIILENGDGMMHDLAIPDLHVQTAMASRKDSAVEVTFTTTEAATYPYFCTVSGHRQAGMEGSLVISPAAS